jgi:membrane AbrB-like protein
MGRNRLRRRRKDGDEQKKGNAPIGSFAGRSPLRIRTPVRAFTGRLALRTTRRFGALCGTGLAGRRVARSVYLAAQAVVGTALGAGFSPATLLTLPRHFSIFAFAVIFILLSSLFNGWILTRSTRLDVATAFLGTMPGGAGEMAAMSESLGADSRLVVIMQYTRLLLILASLALATPFLSHHSVVCRRFCKKKRSW